MSFILNLNFIILIAQSFNSAFANERNNSILNIVKCCGENEALDVQSRKCFQKSQSSNELDYLMDFSFLFVDFAVVSAKMIPYDR